MIKKNISKIITIAVLLVFFWYFGSNLETFKDLLSVPAWLIAVLLGLNIVRIYNNGTFLRYSISYYDKKISVIESYYVSLITSMGNYFGPALGGTGVRALYLKKKHQLSYSDFAATLSGFYFVTFIVNSAIGLIALAFIDNQLNLSSSILYLTYAGWLLASIYLASVRSIEGVVKFISFKFKAAIKPFEFINRAVKSWNGMKRNRKLFYKLNIVTINGFLILFAITFVEFKAIGINNVSLASVALYVTLVTLSLLLSITPGALGIREAILIFTSELLGLNTAEILAISLIDRAALFIALLASFLAFKISGFVKNKQKSRSVFI